jgi:DNA-directed RNA polymerase specialized sigma24 family protein
LNCIFGYSRGRALALGGAVTSEAERRSAPGPSQQSQVRDDRDTFAEMFDAHAQHVFDYCYWMLGDRARATSATQVTLVAAHSLAGRLKDAGRMRAFVLALGRRECLGGGQGLAGTTESHPTIPGGSDDFAAALAFVDQADDQTDEEADDAGAGDAGAGDGALPDCGASAGPSLRATLQALPGEDREILHLLYRHDVSITDLAPLLGVPATRVPGMLAAAKSKFAARASETAPPAEAGPVSPDVHAEQLSAVRLVSLPDSVRRRTARVVMDPGFPSYREAVCARAEHLGPDGFPVQSAATPAKRKLLIASALMAGLLLAPAAAGGAVYATVGTPAHVAGHHPSPAVTRGGSAARGSATRDLSAAGKARSRPRSHRSQRRGRHAR